MRREAAIRENRVLDIPPTEGVGSIPQMGQGQKLKLEREEIGVSREAVCAKADISWMALANTEEERSVPRRVTMKAIRAALDELRAAEEERKGVSAAQE